MQVKIHELFDHTDTNGDNIKVVTIGNMQGVVVTIQPKGSDGGVSAALDFNALSKIAKILEQKAESIAWKWIDEARDRMKK